MEDSALDDYSQPWQDWVCISLSATYSAMNLNNSCIENTGIKFNSKISVTWRSMHWKILSTQIALGVHCHSSQHKFNKPVTHTEAYIQ